MDLENIFGPTVVVDLLEIMPGSNGSSRATYLIYPKPKGSTRLLSCARGIIRQ